MTGHRSVLLLAVLGSIGCGAARPVRAQQSLAPAAPEQAAWHEVALPRLGLSASFPAPPTEISEPSESNGVRTTTTGFALVTGQRELACIVVELHVKDREEDAQALDRFVSAYVAKPTRKESVSAGDLVGVEVEGSNRAGLHRMTRTFIVGSSLVVATVDDEDKRFDRELARRFLDGCRFSPSWRVFADLHGGFTVSVPALALVLEPKRMEGDTLVQSFFVGGRSQLIYIVASTRLEPDADVTPDARLEAVAQSLMDQGSQVVAQSPVELDGMRGRDLLIRDQGRAARWRFFIAPSFIYGLAVSATDQSLLSGADAKRFFGSFVPASP